MAAGVDPKAVKEAVKAILQPIPGIGTIDTRLGGKPTWVTSPGAKRCYTEVSIASVRRARLAGALMIEESPVVQVDLWMPIDYSQKSEDAFDALVPRVCDALDDNRKLGGLVDNGDTAQVVRWGHAPFADGQKTEEVHHATITMEYTRERQTGDG